MQSGDMTGYLHGFTLPDGSRRKPVVDGAVTNGKGCVDMLGYFAVHIVYRDLDTVQSGVSIEPEAVVAAAQHSYEASPFELTRNPRSSDLQKFYNDADVMALITRQLVAHVLDQLHDGKQQEAWWPVSLRRTIVDTLQHDPDFVKLYANEGAAETATKRITFVAFEILANIMRGGTMMLRESGTGLISKYDNGIRLPEGCLLITATDVPFEKQKETRLRKWFDEKMDADANFLFHLSSALEKLPAEMVQQSLIDRLAHAMPRDGMLRELQAEAAEYARAERDVRVREGYRKLVAIWKNVNGQLDYYEKNRSHWQALRHGTVQRVSARLVGSESEVDETAVFSLQSSIKTLLQMVKDFEQKSGAITKIELNIEANEHETVNNPIANPLRGAFGASPKLRGA